MALDPNILLQQTTPDLGAALRQAISAGQAIKDAPLRRKLMEAQAQRAQSITQLRGIDPAQLRTRQALIEQLDSPNPEVAQSARIALKLEAGAAGSDIQQIDIGGVPHIFDRRTQSVTPVRTGGEAATAESIGESKGIIAGAEARGKAEGELAADTIDKGFKSISSIQSNVRNIDRAIGAIDRGAQSGVVQRLLPSVRSASIELDQIRNELGLDVVGATTFGALSAGELSLALNTALPTNLKPDDLRVWLQNKKAAQNKLLGYFQRQIDFIDQGGTIPEFLRAQRSQTEAQQVAPSPQVQPAQQSPQQQQQFAPGTEPPPILPAEPTGAPQIRVIRRR